MDNSLVKTIIDNFGVDFALQNFKKDDIFKHGISMFRHYGNNFETIGDGRFEQNFKLVGKPYTEKGIVPVGKPTININFEHIGGSNYPTVIKPNFEHIGGSNYPTVIDSSQRVNTQGKPRSYNYPVKIEDIEEATLVDTSKENIGKTTSKFKGKWKGAGMIAGAVALGGLALNAASNKGQLSNAQLYGQRPLY